MKICDRCRTPDMKVNIRTVVIYSIKQELCNNCEKELEKIFWDFIQERGLDDEPKK